MVEGAEFTGSFLVRVSILFAISEIVLYALSRLASSRRGFEPIVSHNAGSFSSSLIVSRTMFGSFISEKLRCESGAKSERVFLSPQYNGIHLSIGFPNQPNYHHQTLLIIQF